MQEILVTKNELQVQAYNLETMSSLLLWAAGRAFKAPNSHPMQESLQQQYSPTTPYPDLCRQLAEKMA